MLVSDLNLVHTRYITLSNVFKSAWTFHQFLQGLHKASPDTSAPSYDAAEFQTIYALLKEISGNLNEQGAEIAAPQLEDVGERLESLNDAMLAADQQIGPGSLREFFQRVKNYDDAILSQLVKFYLYTHRGRGWPIDRLDKVDYLVTKLCEEKHEGSDVHHLRHPDQLRDLAHGLWTALGELEVDDGEIASLGAELEVVREKLRTVESIDELDESALVQTYRQLKHSLGPLFFHPKLLLAVAETNLVAKNRIQKLYQREEQRIVAEYQQVFDLEREMPQGVRLRTELAQFRSAVERFETQLERSNIRLAELASLRRQVRGLLPKLRADIERTGPIAAIPDFHEPDEPLVESHPPEDAEYPEYRYVAQEYREVVAALEGTSAQMEPKHVTLAPEIFGYALEAREVMAFRRLDADEPCNRASEELMLRAAALRVRINEEVEEIKSLLDESAATRDAPVFHKARRTCRMGDLYIRRFDHALGEAMMDGDLDEAQTLMVLRMRMMRTYAGLWLMVHRP